MGKNMATKIFNILDQYNVAEKLFCITTDNASNNGKCMRKLSKLLRQWKGTIWDHDAKHISCLNHVTSINIAVQVFLKKCKVLDASSFELPVPVDEESDDNEDSDDEHNEDEDEDEGDEGDESDGEEEQQSIVMNEEVIEAAQSFQVMIWKLRELAKVCLCSYKSAQFVYNTIYRIKLIVGCWIKSSA